VTVCCVVDMALYLLYIGLYKHDKNFISQARL
jgi:hypothetical protein